MKKMSESGSGIKTSRICKTGLDKLKVCVSGMIVASDFYYRCVEKKNIRMYIGQIKKNCPQIFRDPQLIVCTLVDSGIFVVIRFRCTGYSFWERPKLVVRIFCRICFLELGVT
jgi:hypothetical protein